MIEQLFLWYALIGVVIFFVGHWLDVIHTFKPIWHKSNFDVLLVSIVAWPVLIYTVWIMREK